MILFSRLQWFFKDQTANVAVITALCALPLFALTGLAIDYAIELSAKAQLDQAADAAAVAAITTAKTVIGGGGTVASAQSQGQAQGVKAFNTTAGTPRFLSGNIPTPTVQITPNGQVLTATVSYVTSTVSQFGKFFNIASNNIRGSTTSSAVVNPYYQFIFVVDISGSMSVGGTSTDIAGLIGDSRIQCGFACHDPYHNRGPDYRAYAKADGWTLKIDYVNSAIQNFITDLQAQTANLSGVFSIGIDTFASNFNVLLAPTTNFATAKSVASTIDIEDMLPYSVATQGYTQTTSSLLAASSQLTNVGDGTAVNKQQTYIILLSDGVEDIEGNMMYSRGTDVSYTSACSTLKSRSGLTMITVGTPYPTIPGDSQYATLVAPWETSNTPNATASMQSCASGSNWAFQATNGPEIDTAVQQALSQILQGLTRLTQ